MYALYIHICHNVYIIYVLYMYIRFILHSSSSKIEDIQLDFFYFRVWCAESRFGKDQIEDIMLNSAKTKVRNDVTQGLSIYLSVCLSVYPSLYLSI